MNHQRSWERLLAWLVVGAIALQLAASVLPRLLTPIVVLTAVFVVVRLVLSTPASEWIVISTS